MTRHLIPPCACWALFACVGLAAGTADTPAALDKKLIQYGWGIPTTPYVKDHIREMEKRPFDGLIFRLGGGMRVLTPKAWDEAKFTKDYEAAKQIQWKRFTDNFIIMLAASDQDWFSDAHWQAITHNARLMTKAARLARCVGVCFDQEPYGTNPWAYSRVSHRDTKSFAQYEAKVRQRGAEFVRAVEAELPGATILTFFQLSYFDQVLVAMDPRERAEKISGLHYSLLPAFLNGMLDAASPGVRIVDGNERAYYYRDRQAYSAAYHTMKQRALLLVDPKLRTKYERQVQAGFAMYLDQYFGLRTRKVEGHYMTPEDRARWCEHNAYWALYTTDKYVWCYCERMHWFRNQNIPPGCEEALRSARAKLAKGEPLTTDLRPVMEEVERKRKAEISKRLVRRQAEVRRLPKGTPQPRIDGDLTDPAWQKTKPLQPLLALASHPSKLKATTEARVTYDNAALFVAVRCDEPAIKRMNIVGKEHDDDIWAGEDMEVQVCVPGKTSPFYHFMVNPRNVRWDGLQKAGGVDKSYDPEWQHAVRVGPKAWTVEMAIPWAAMDMKAPQPGAVLRANVCRQRRWARELSAWSPMVKGFLEHELYGTWVFK